MTSLHWMPLAILVAAGCALPSPDPGREDSAVTSEDASADDAPTPGDDGSDARDPGEAVNVPNQMPGTDEPVGTWYLNADGARLTLTIASDTTSARFSGTLTPEATDATAGPLTRLTWNPTAKRLRFQHDAGVTHRW